MKIFQTILLLGGLCLTPVVLWGQSVNISANRNNTMFELLDKSNGAGDHLFVGKTNEPSNSLRRALLQFDVAGNVPVGATITGASITLKMNKTSNGTNSINLHRLTEDWGEGTSDAPSGEGQGTASTAGDANWNCAFYGMGSCDTPWAVVGGTFNPAPSATEPVSGTGNYTWGESAQLLADVIDMRTNPSLNFGWILVGDEVNPSAKRFDSRHNSTPPVLTVTYTLPCTDPDVPSNLVATPNTICPNGNSTLTWDGELNSATQWHIYRGACDGVLEGTSSTNSFVVSPLSSTNYFIRGEDGNGCVDESTGVCGSITVNTEDNVSPTALCKNATVYIDETGLATIAVSDVNNGSSDNCGEVFFDLSRTSFSCESLGENFVTLYVSDVNGNLDSCLSTITILDTLPPQVTCPNSFLSCDFLVVDIAANINENCLTSNVEFNFQGATSGSGTGDASGAVLNTGITEVTYTVTDASNNTSTCSFEIEIPPLRATDFQTACDSFTWIDGNTYYADNNIATDTLESIDGCDSIVTLDLTIESLDLTVSVTDTTFTANETGAEYQWLVCPDMAPIFNETNAVFEGTWSNEFAVIITKNGCSDTSDCYGPEPISVGEQKSNRFVQIFPNPNQGAFLLELGSFVGSVQVKLHDLQGKTHFNQFFDSIHIIPIELELNSGIYILEIQMKNTTVFQKVIIE